MLEVAEENTTNENEEVDNMSVIKNGNEVMRSVGIISKH